MKTIKLLLVFVFCFAVAVPAMAQKVAVSEVAPAIGNQPKIPSEAVEECIDCGLPATIDFSVGEVAPKELGPTEGTLNHYVYQVEAQGAEGMRARVINAEKEYTLVMEKFRDGDGKMQTVKYCEGNEKYCKAIAGGRECDTSTIPSELCFLKQEEAPKLDLGPTLAVEKPKEAVAAEAVLKADSVKALK